MNDIDHNIVLNTSMKFCYFCCTSFFLYLNVCQSFGSSLISSEGATSIIN